MMFVIGRKEERKKGSEVRNRGKKKWKLKI